MVQKISQYAHEGELKRHDAQRSEYFFISSKKKTTYTYNFIGINKNITNTILHKKCIRIWSYDFGNDRKLETQVIIR